VHLKNNSQTKFIVVAGGVISGVGKGIATASIGKILQEYGYSVTAVKIDPYINCDAGTLRPTEHGEVWVTEDGGEIDQDLGNYERFFNQQILKANNITTGQVYKKIIEKERKGEFLGQTVQFIPHVPDEIKSRVKESAKGFDICLVEIGGTIGDYENIPFLFAMKSLEREIGKENLIYILVTYLPVPGHITEMKTKPTQQSMKMMMEVGIFPDFVLCRSKIAVDDVRKRKIETYSNIRLDHIISAPDVDSIYQVPLNFEKEKLGLKILSQLCLKPKKKPEWTKWQKLVTSMLNPKFNIKVAMVCKYIDIGNFELTDAYVSINEALKHASAYMTAKIKIDWIDAKKFENNKEELKKLLSYNGIIVPGGFGNSGVEGKISAIKFAREHNIPFLGLCYGMQLAIVEFARNICKMQGANTTENDKKTHYPVIDILEEQKKILANNLYGGTMRLGSYVAMLEPGSVVYKLYKERGRIEIDKKLIQSTEKFRLGLLDKSKPIVLERHRHRYEVNPKYIPMLERNNMLFSGYHLLENNTKLIEFIELKHHKFFIATQSHPEFKSRFLSPAPLFLGFVRACLE